MFSSNDLFELHKKFKNSGSITDEDRSKLIEAIRNKNLAFFPDTVCCKYYNQGRNYYDKTDSETCIDLLKGEIVDSTKCG